MFLSSLIFSTKYIVGIFSASTITAFFICLYNGVPFFNPEQNRYQFIQQLQKTGKTSSIVLGQSVVAFSLFSNYLIDNSNHYVIDSFKNLALYSVITEFFYYTYHRIVHTKSYYKQGHSLHHQNVVVFPADTFYQDTNDAFFLVFSLAAPSLFLRMNYTELAIILYIYGTGAYLAHSNNFFNHHDIHHRLMFCNYCILNPVFDILFRTYR